MSVFIVAEAGVNHLGDRAKMLALCDAAKVAGADAVKFQAYSTSKLIERRGKGDRDLLAKCELTDEDLDAIAAHCKGIGFKWFASVFDPSQIERVLSRGACALKIGHAEADWDELYEACDEAAWHRDPEVPVWISGDREKVRRCNVSCTPEYPAVSPPRLKFVSEWCDAHERELYRGFSSHYTDYHIPAAAALRGAEYIEAHLMLGEREERFNDAGHLVYSALDEPEAAWSLNPDDFGKMVKLIRKYEGWL